MIRVAPTNRYEFAVLSALRAHQLMDGCTPRVSGDRADHKLTTMAQLEVAAGLVARDPGTLVP